MRDLLILIGIVIGLVIIGFHVEADKINSRYGTDYTASDLFFFGDKIVLSDHIAIKEKK